MWYQVIVFAVAITAISADKRCICNPGVGNVIAYCKCPSSKNLLNVGDELTVGTYRGRIVRAWDSNDSNDSNNGDTIVVFLRSSGTNSVQNTNGVAQLFSDYGTCICDVSDGHVLPTCACPFLNNLRSGDNFAIRYLYTTPAQSWEILGGQRGRGLVKHVQYVQTDTEQSGNILGQLLRSSGTNSNQGGNGVVKFIRYEPTNGDQSGNIFGDLLGWRGSNANQNRNGVVKRYIVRRNNNGQVEIEERTQRSGVKRNNGNNYRDLADCVTGCLSG
ncbi:uncharacterized protein LOC107040312 [Diachasma alloeum]|uniref:uncharacterized protein LOC107040312 n=1 Tax=Diachasma alloeum TaxID=454923 RepID=UPI0007381687|nr:uncharacterized protein LOC107040312 [Diachasma alloeum]